MLFVTNVVFVAVSFVFFYFGATYMAGVGLKDLTVSSLWSELIYCISFVGTLLYRFVEMVCGGVCRVFNIRRYSSKAVVLDFILMLVGLIVIVVTGQLLFDDLFASVAVEVEYNIDGWNEQLGVLSNSMTIFTLLQWNIANSNGWYDALSSTLALTIAYVCWYVVYYAILFGYLESRVLELHPLSKRGIEIEIDDAPLNINGLFQRIKGCLYQFIDELMVIRAVKVPAVCFLIIAASVGVIYYQQEMGDGINSFDDMFVSVIDLIGIVDVFKSFILAVIVQLLFQLFILLVIRIAPPSVIEWYIASNRRSTERMREAKEKRTEWSKRHDNSWPHYESGKVHEMHLG